MPPAHFLPRKSGAHRIACIALYRALLSHCSRIPLPDELLTRGKVNPLKHLIRKKFKQNKDVTSHQQVVKVLKSGYVYETLLRRAANNQPSSKSQLLTLLSTLHSHSLHASSTPPNPPKKPLPHRPARPTHTPSAPKMLDIRPLPLLKINGIRQIPTINFTSAGTLATLKFKKALPSYVSRVIRQKDHKRMRWFDGIEGLHVELENCRYEEEWEGLVMDVAEEENAVRATEEEVWGDWRDVVVRGEGEVRGKLTRLLGEGERVARRMMGIVEEERELAITEGRERRHRRKEERWRAKKERWRVEGIKSHGVR